MLSLVPIAGTPVSFSQIFRALRRGFDKGIRAKFIADFGEVLGLGDVFPTDTGLASFYIILEALKGVSEKKEVILPAYTAGNLITAVKKAGLIPVLCDISLEDFNFDREALFRLIGADTLAVVLVHMYGIAISDIAKVKSRIPRGVYVIEDCAQSLGSKVDGRNIGSFGDVSFFSFNRGKNISTYAGGCFFARSKELADISAQAARKLAIKNGLSQQIAVFLKTLAVSLAVRPFVYGAGYHLISRFKDLEPISDFEVKEMTGFQLALGLELFKKMEVFSRLRYENGMFIINALKDNQSLVLPRIAQGIFPVFNRFPLLFKDPSKVELALKKLRDNGIEASRMYLRPLYAIFGLPYRKEDFPNTEYFSPRLLTLPVHPGVRKKHLITMAKAINEL